MLAAPSAPVAAARVIAALRNKSSALAFANVVVLGASEPMWDEVLLHALHRRAVVSVGASPGNVAGATPSRYYGIPAAPAGPREGVQRACLAAATCAIFAAEQLHALLRSPPPPRFPAATQKLPSPRWISARVAASLQRHAQKKIVLAGERSPCRVGAGCGTCSPLLHCNGWAPDAAGLTARAKGARLQVGVPHAHAVEIAFVREALGGKASVRLRVHGKKKRAQRVVTAELDSTGAGSDAVLLVDFEDQRPRVPGRRVLMGKRARAERRRKRRRAGESSRINTSAVLEPTAQIRLEVVMEHAGLMRLTALRFFSAET